MALGRLAATISLFLMLLSAPQPTFAETYPTKELGTDDVHILLDPKTDLALRIELIKRAQKSINIAAYDIRPDDIYTFPLLSALRDAADRGVQVRLLTSWIPEWIYDRRHTLARYLLDPPTAIPIHIVVFGGQNLASKGWALFDSMHEKIFIVDDKYALATGRGIAENYLNWLDTSFPIKGVLVEQNLAAFKSVWNDAIRLQGLYRGYIGWYQNPRPYAKRYDLRMPLSEDETREVQDTLAWYDTASIRAQDPAKAPHGRALHFDFIKQLDLRYPSPREASFDERAQALQDPVLDSLIEKLDKAGEIRLSILTLVLHPRFKEALIAAHKKGTRIKLITNIAIPSLHGRTPKQRLTPGGATWYMELPDLDDLLASGVPVHQFQVAEKDAQNPWIYLHRKLAVIDDTVIFGSHNFNLLSSVGNDELSFEITDPALAAKARLLFDNSIFENTEPLDPAFVHQARKNCGAELFRFLLEPFLGLM